MKLVKIQDVNAYEPPNHFNMVALKVQGADETGITKFWQGFSKFETDGGADWQYGAGTFGADTQKTYFVIEGQITVEDEAGNQYVLEQYDSIAILPNEKRKMWNSGSVQAKALVTVSA